MSAQLEIVFTDRGQAPQPMRAQPGGESAQERAPGPADQVRGPKKRDDESISAAEGGVKAIEMIAKAAGLGGIAAVVKELASAFSALFKSVTRSTVAHADNAEAVKSSTKASRPDIVGPRPSRTIPDEPIDVDFELKGPKPGLTPTGPRRPDGGGGELIRAPQELSTRHAATRVETVGISGPRPVPPIAGPAAGAGTAASGMASLAAAAGPAAIAVAALTVAVVGGAVAVKKVFDGLVREGERLSGFSAQLSAATAVADIRSELADLRRAQRVGPGLARVTDRSSRLSEQTAELGTRVIDLLLKIEQRFSPVIEAATAIVEVINKGYDAAEKRAETLKPVTEALLWIIAPAAMGTNEAAKLILRLLQKETDKGAEDTADLFMDAFLANFGPPPAVPPAAPPGGGIGP